MAEMLPIVSRIEIGSAFPRGEGVWIVKWRKAGEKPWRQHRCRGARDSIEARAIAARDLCALDAPTAATFGAWFAADFLPGLPVADSTRKLYAQHWRVWCAPALGALRWEEVTSGRIDAWIRALRRAPTLAKGHRRTLSPAYVRALYSLVSAALERAAAQELLARNPAKIARKLLPRPEGVKARARAHSPEELVRLVGCPAIPFSSRVRYKLSALAMLRPGEARALRWADVDFAARTITVRASSRSKKELGPTKSRRVRVVPMHPELVPTLEAWRDGWRIHQGRKPEESDFVFPGRSGGVLAPNVAGFFAHCRRAGVPEIVPHGLRHTGASCYRVAGVTIDDLRVLMGHASGITEHYARPTLEHLSREIAKFRLPKWVARRELDGAPAAHVLLGPMPHAPASDSVAELEEGTARKGLAQSATFLDSASTPSPQSSGNSPGSTALAASPLRCGALRVSDAHGRSAAVLLDLEQPIAELLRVLRLAGLRAELVDPFQLDERRTRIARARARVLDAARALVADWNGVTVDVFADAVRALDALEGASPRGSK